MWKRSSLGYGGPVQGPHYGGLRDTVLWPGGRLSDLKGLGAGDPTTLSVTTTLLAMGREQAQEHVERRHPDPSWGSAGPGSSAAGAEAG